MDSTQRSEGQPAWRSTMVVVSAGLFAAYAMVDVSWDVAGRHGSYKPGSLSAATP